MKKIVEGKRYDTTRAEEIASWGNHYYVGDFHHCEETLYRTKGGAFFLHGEGGPLSGYAEACGNNSWCSGSDIRPLTPQEAFRLCEEHDQIDAMEKHFADLLTDA